jgi:hypothetical protein
VYKKTHARNDVQISIGRQLAASHNKQEREKTMNSTFKLIPILALACASLGALSAMAVEPTRCTLEYSKTAEKLGHLPWIINQHGPGPYAGGYHEDCLSALTDLKDADDAKNCSVDWNMVKLSIPSQFSECRSAVDSIIASNNPSQSSKKSAKGTSSTICESVTEAYADCQGRHYIRDTKSVADKRNPMKQVLERANSAHSKANVTSESERAD